MEFKDLKKLQGIDTAIELKEHQIARLKARPLSTVSHLSGAPGHSGVSDKVGCGVSDVLEKEPILQSQLAELKRRQRELTEYIQSIDDATVQSAVEQYVYLHETWQNIALKCNYSESGIRYRVKAYMKKFSGNCRNKGI